MRIADVPRSARLTLALVSLVLGVALGAPVVAQEADPSPDPSSSSETSAPSLQTSAPEASPSASASASMGPQSAAGTEAAAPAETLLPLEGTSWRLTAVGPEAASVAPEVAAWMTLRAGSVDGWTGCGVLAGSYGRAGTALRVRPAEAGRGRCPAARREIATALTKGLVRTVGHAIEWSEDGATPNLILRDADGAQVLRLEPDDVGSLTDDTWQLRAFQVGEESRTAVESPPAELTFTGEDADARERRERGALVGSSGCNGIVGTFRRAGDRLSLEGVETTDAPCSGELEAQESAMLGVLSSSDLRLDLPPDRLVLTDATTGDRLELVSSAPLEGSTWLLGTLPGVPEAEAPVTLRLEGGLLSGEGPCGPYQGTYESDGRFVRFGDLAGTGGSGCRARQRQRKLLLALQRAVLIDRDQPQLRLLDAAGDLVAAFDRPPGP